MVHVVAAQVRLLEEHGPRTGDASRALHAACGFELVGVEREVGRVLGQNTRAAKLFQVTVETIEQGGTPF